MRFTLERVSGPLVSPITLEQMKVHLRAYADQTDEDAEITGIVTAAREWVEDYTGRALVEQSWRLSIDRRIGNAPGRSITAPSTIETNGYGWYAGEANESVSGILLRKSPAIAIVSVAIVAADGTETVVAASDYRIESAASKWPSIVPLAGAAWGDVFRVTFRAGFAPGVGSPDPAPDVTLVPVRFTQAMKLYASALYDGDEKMMPLLMETAKRLIESERADLSLA